MDIIFEEENFQNLLKECKDEIIEWQNELKNNLDLVICEIYSDINLYNYKNHQNFPNYQDLPNNFYFDS